MRNFITTVLKAATVLMVAFMFNSNPAFAGDKCEGCADGQTCKYWLGEWKCVTVCCDDSKCSETCYKRHKSSKLGVCINTADKDTVDEWFAKRAASASTAKIKKALEKAQTELEIATEELGKTKKAIKDTTKDYVTVLKAQIELIKLEIKAAKVEYAKSLKVWTETKGITEIDDERDELKKKMDTLNKKITEIDPTKITSAETLISNPDEAELNDLKAKLKTLQKLNAELKNLTTACMKARIAVEKAAKAKKSSKIEEEFKDKDETITNLQKWANNPRNHHLFVGGGISIAGVHDDKIISEIQAGYDFTYYWRYFQLFARICLQAGNLSSGNGYWGPDAMGGFRVGSKWFWFQAGIGTGYVFPTNMSDGDGLLNLEAAAGPMFQFRNIAALGILFKYSSEMPVDRAPRGDSYSEKDILSLMVELTFGLGPPQ